MEEAVPGSVLSLTLTSGVVVQGTLVARNDPFLVVRKQQGDEDAYEFISESSVEDCEVFRVSREPIEFPPAPASPTEAEAKLAAARAARADDARSYLAERVRQQLGRMYPGDVRFEGATLRVFGLMIAPPYAAVAGYGDPALKAIVRKELAAARAELGLRR
eukprot:gnl/Chilomastix_cuspidata/500.p4 GENE.gnl/Chilomastix_cuspidata/500~~gnl/Chilomastix_cuspidata/500.p4  ORF type:complete len:161 (-),score=71.20 gnl/Chilomastix_cuspidata/500:305-787(-)